MKTIINLSAFRCFLFYLLILFVTSCDEFVQVDLPNSQLTATAVFEDKATAAAAMTAVYSKIRDNSMLSGSPIGLSHTVGNYTDELTYYGSGTIEQFYANAVSPTSTEVRNLWTTSYNQIYASNAIIYGVNNSKTLDPIDRATLKGEALFVRALLHFYLTNVFGDVPYISSTAYTQNSTVKRQAENEVYALLKKDLVEAVDLLPDDYINADRTRPNTMTARALLARVNLYMGLYAEASNDASAVLNATELYSISSNLNAVFKKNSPSTLWQLSPALSGNSTQEGSTFLFTSGPPPRSAVSSDLVASFQAEDLRKTSWLKAVTSGGNTWYMPFKYKNQLTVGSGDEHSVMFRIEEQYLIRAEARARQGELTNAKEDLNVVRNRAGLEDTFAVTVTELLDAIIQERRHEFFTELGHRFFDLKRTNSLDSVLSPLKPGWDATDYFLPLPAAELLLNPNLLPQNPGY